MLALTSGHPTAAGSLAPGQTVSEGDWRCPTCSDLQFARNPTCRKCGTQKPHYLATAKGPTAEEMQLALMPSIPELAGLTMGGEWVCPMCKEVTFAGRNTCRRCNCPRPEGARIENQVQHQLAGGGYIGYLPDVTKVEATSSWAKQWDAPAPAVMMPFNAIAADSPFALKCAKSDSSSDSSSSSDSEPKKKRQKKDAKSSDDSSSSNDAEKKQQKKEEKKRLKKEKKEKRKAKAKAKAREKEKANAKKASKTEKKKKKAMDVEQELEKRRLQRERRKGRAIALDD